jgi:hypothetical protein
MFKVSLVNQVRQTPLSKRQSLLPLFEAVMNAMQAINDRRRIEPGHRGAILVELSRETTLFGAAEGLALIEDIRVSDDGIGMNDENWDSFNTSFSGHRYLDGGKGLGRIIWLKAFNSVQIVSTFQGKDGPLRRLFTFDFEYDGENLPQLSAGGTVGTSIKLTGFKSPYKEATGLDAGAIADRMVEHFFLFFVRGDNPNIVLVDETSTIDLNRFFHDNYAALSTQHDFVIGDQSFRARGFRIASGRLDAHRLVYAAHGRAVRREKLAKFIPNLASRLDDGANGFFYQIVVESPYLDERVNRERTAFEIQTADEVDDDDLIGASEISLRDIRDRALVAVRADLGSFLDTMDAEKLRRIDEFVSQEAPHYRILLKRREQIVNKIAPDASRKQIDAVMHSELRDLELAMKAQGQRVLQDAEHIDDYEAYRAELTTFIEQYNELGIASLAHHVMHRKIIIDLFEKALKKSEDGDAYPLESVVHKVVFPMRATSDDVLYSQHNLWLVDERLAYHSHISSDRSLAKTPLADSDAKLRPDLAVFDQKGLFADEGKPLTSVVLVEFKRPGRNAYSGDDPLEQLFRLSEEIKAGRHTDENGRPVRVANNKVPIFAYLVCDIPPALRILIKGKDAQEMADGMGFYGYNRNYGVYYEVLEYEKILADAKKRNRILFEKLTLP